MNQPTMNQPTLSKARNLLTTPEAWRIVSEDPFESAGAISFNQGTLKLEKGNPGTGINYRGPLPRIDYRLTAQAQRTGGQDFFYGVTFPINDQHASLIIGGWGGGVTGISNLDGMSAVENETTGYTAFENNRWYTIILEVTQKQIRVTIDDRQIFQLRTSTRQYSVWPQQATMCPLGIATWNTSAEIRKLALERLV